MSVLRVLGVDDEQDILEVIRLQLLGYENVDLLTFSDPLKAMDYLENNKAGDFALALVDIKMPGMGGIEFMTRLKELSPQTVRINMSSHADLQLVLEALGSNHIFDFIRKPLSREDFLSSVSKGLEYFKLSRDRDDLAEKLKEKNKVLEDWNLKLDLEVQRKTFELKLRDDLMQHLAGCHPLPSPFRVVSDFVAETVGGVHHAIYYTKGASQWTLRYQSNQDSCPKTFHSLESIGPRCGEVSREELDKLRSDMACSNEILWAEILQYRGGVVGLWCVVADTLGASLPQSIRDSFLRFSPLVGMLLYDELSLNSVAEWSSLQWVKDLSP